jgi:hypothetical protein
MIITTKNGISNNVFLLYYNVLVEVLDIQKTIALYIYVIRGIMDLLKMFKVF